MEIVLIRHAEPEWVKDGKSVVNPPLTVRGSRQAELLGQRLADEKFDHVFAFLYKERISRLNQR